MFVTYNRLELTKRMLTSLYQTVDVPYRLIIVDNGSTDGTVEFLQEMEKISTLQTENGLHMPYMTLDIHYFEKNMGIAVGRNQGLKLADKYQDPWLATVDNDVELPQGWLKECIEIIEANPNYTIGVNMEGVAYPVISKNGKNFQNKTAGNLGTAAAVFNRRLHQLIGFFCMDFGLYGEEDADFFFRARVGGFQCGYIERAGNHFGIGELDTGEYRKFKDGCRTNNITNFQKKCYQYLGGKQSIYIPFD